MKSIGTIKVYSCKSNQGCSHTSALRNCLAPTVVRRVCKKSKLNSSKGGNYI